MKISRILLAASLGWSLSPAVTSAQTGGPQYVVQSGDTLYDIARRFGIPLEALQAANPEVQPAALGVGQALSIPGFEGLSGTLSTHTLEPGETLDSLALRLGLKRDTLIRLNRILNPDWLYINQSIVLIDPVDGGPGIPAGATRAVRAGEGMLALAAASNHNPWALAGHNRLPHPGLLVPNALVVLPGGDQPVRALPLPLVELRVFPLPAEQGRTASVRVVTAIPALLTGSLSEWPLHFNADDRQANTYYALLGLPRLADPDLYRLTLSAAKEGGVIARFSQPLPVREGGYLLDRPLTVDPATLDPAVTEPELQQVQAIVAPFSSPRQWDGLMALPSVGALRSVFGSLRSYNGGPYDSYHTGVDFSGAEDRPITAPASGVVAFAGPLAVRGNATIIDHGWGVYSGYWHQSLIQVAVGDRVQTGQVIGFQGATGRVTGPHLHWELWVGGIQVDPLQWTVVAFP